MSNLYILIATNILICFPLSCHLYPDLCRPIFILYNINYVRYITFYSRMPCWEMSKHFRNYKQKWRWMLHNGLFLFFVCVPWSINCGTTWTIEPFRCWSFFEDVKVDLALRFFDDTFVFRVDQKSKITDVK